MCVSDTLGEGILILIESLVSLEVTPCKNLWDVSLIFRTFRSICNYIASWLKKVYTNFLIGRNITCRAQNNE